MASKKSTPVRRSKKVWQWNAVLAAIAKASATNRKNGSKPHYENEKLAKAVAKATAVPSLTEAKVSMSKGSAEARRKHCRTNRLTAVSVYDIVRKDDITHDRPELTVLSRLGTIATAMGLPKDTFFAVRSEAYKPDEVPEVFIIRR